MNFMEINLGKKLGGGGGGTIDAYTKAETDQLLDGKADLVDGKVPASELPSYVDDTIEGYYYEGAFYEDSSHTTVITGETGKIYIDLTANKSYRWTGTVYVRIDECPAFGETQGTIYEGNKGKQNADAIAAIKDGANIDSFADVETALANKADKSATYTKTEVDALLSAGKYFENKLFSGTTDTSDIFTYTIPANKIVRITAQMMYTNSHPKYIEIVSVLNNTNFMCDSAETENSTTINCLTVSAIIGPRGAANTIKVNGKWFTAGNNNVSIYVEALN